MFLTMQPYKKHVLFGLNIRNELVPVRSVYWPERVELGKIKNFRVGQSQQPI